VLLGPGLGRDADEVESIIPLHAGETDQKDSCAREAILCAKYRGGHSLRATRYAVSG
jgi:hypothetical protein